MTGAASECVSSAAAAVSAAREALVVLRKLLPELLSRCQLARKWQCVALEAGADAVTAQRLGVALRERDVLREHALACVDRCGSELADVRLLVTACVSLDDKLCGGVPVARALAEFCHAVPARRAALMQRLKALRASAQELRGSAPPSRSSSAGSSGEEEDVALLRELLLKLRAALSRALEVDALLGKVKADTYVQRFEDERAALTLERQGLGRKLERWVERNREREGAAWRAHGELASAILLAVDARLDADLLAAIRDDIARFAEDETIFPDVRGAKERALRLEAERQRTRLKVRALERRAAAPAPSSAAGRLPGSGPPGVLAVRTGHANELQLVLPVHRSPLRRVPAVAGFNNNNSSRLKRSEQQPSPAQQQLRQWGPGGGLEICGSRHAG
jgi:hypothetical protein